MNAYKTCYGCGHTQSVDQFAAAPWRVDGLEARCISCKPNYNPRHMVNCIKCRKEYIASGSTIRPCPFCKQQEKWRIPEYRAKRKWLRRRELAEIKVSQYKRASRFLGWPAYLVEIVKAIPPEVLNWPKRQETLKQVRDRVHSALRRMRMKNAPGNYTYIAWLQKVAYYGWKCVYCSKSLTHKTLTCDHKKPISRGGSNFISNLFPACKSCNSSKLAKLDWKIKYRVEPQIDRCTPALIVRSHSAIINL